MYACIKPMVVDLADNLDVFSDHEMENFKIVDLGKDFIPPENSRPIPNGADIKWIPIAAEKIYEPETFQDVVSDSIDQI